MMRKSRTSKTETTIVSAQVRGVSRSRDVGSKNADQQEGSRSRNKNDHTKLSIVMNSGNKNKSESRSNKKKEPTAVRKSETAEGSKSTARTTRRVRQVSARK